MKVYVQGLWHLGTVISACLASIGHDVIGVDFNRRTVRELNAGKPLIFEPGLEDLVKAGLASEKLTFVWEINEVNSIDFLWVAYDTSVDDNDNADVDTVICSIEGLIPSLSNNAIVLISSQLPIGSTKKLEDRFDLLCPDKHISFAYSPENLRLGKALNVFLAPDRMVVGTRSEEDKNRINKLLSTITGKIEWMSVESAEMTKHAINSFLATSVAFANEIASICEMTGADAKEVARGLKTEQRIGPEAYLSPGVAFSGGTLARDIEFLKKESKKHNLPIPLLQSVKASNDYHKGWAPRKIKSLYPNLKDIVVAVWGISYKSGTDTLRRSLNAELVDWLLSEGAIIKVYDPTVKNLPIKWDGKVQKVDNLSNSLINAHILFIGTKSTEYEDYFDNTYDWGKNNNLSIIDPNRFIWFLEKCEMINYISIGAPNK